MSANDKILVIIEPDVHPAEVVSRAAWLAKLTRCELELLLCDPDIGVLREGFFLSNEAKEIAGKIRTAQREIIEEIAQPARDAGISVSIDVLEERPIADGVLHRAVDMNPRFVMKGTQYHSAAERSIFVDTDWQLVRSCPYPLWLVKPHEIRQKPVIVAAVDPTHSHDKPAALDQVIVDNAKALAGAAGGELHLLHTYHRLVGIGREATRTFKPIELPVDELSKKIQEDHRARLDKLAKANGIDKQHTHQLPGATKELLPSFVRTKSADLVVMGALARWGLKRAILGSTAEKVLDHLPCDILIVRKQDDED
ncbi:MAG: universal stress protein [Gammaproteobacteria bacterium]|nr:universal stress protein [Gammaproteobacteria bacterium]MDH5345646.1 universal stress protein [Gammaproteobacteria bacterium]